MGQEYKRFGEYIVYIDSGEVMGVIHGDAEIEDLKIGDPGLPIDHNTYSYIRFSDLVVVMDKNGNPLNVLADQDPELGLQDDPEIDEPTPD
jgi:hypothetical protein